MADVVADLAERGVRRLMVEGGGRLHTQFLVEDLADELQLVDRARSSSASRGRRGSSRPGRFPWTAARRATLAETRRIGDVVLLRYALSERFQADATGDRVGRGALRALVRAAVNGGSMTNGAARRRIAVATVAAFATLLAAPLVAGALAAGTPAALLSLPAESIAVVLVLLAIPAAPGRAGSSRASSACVVVVATVVAALDLGFEATIDRAFSLAEDWPAIVSAFGVVAMRPGRRTPSLIVVAAHRDAGRPP